jgi:hypothetical protein
MDRPQFGQAGPGVIGEPTGRNKCCANMVYLMMRASWRVLKRPIEIQTGV